MKTNGYTIYKMGLVSPKTRPLLEQLAAVIRKRDKEVRKRDRCMNLFKDSNFCDVELRAKIAALDHYITHHNFIIVNLQSQLGSKNDPKPTFNRQECKRERSVKPDKGKILYSRDGVYDVSDHKGAVKKVLKGSIITAV